MFVTARIYTHIYTYISLSFSFLTKYLSRQRVILFLTIAYLIRIPETTTVSSCRRFGYFEFFG